MTTSPPITASCPSCFVFSMCLMRMPLVHVLCGAVQMHTFANIYDVSYDSGGHLLLSLAYDKVKRTLADHT